MSPVERVGNFIRARVKSPSLFSEFRYKTLSEEKGIFAIIGHLKGEDKWDIQAYRFAVAKGWTISKAREWLKKHNVAVKWVIIEELDEIEEALNGEYSEPRQFKQGNNIILIL